MLYADKLEKLRQELFISFVWVTSCQEHSMKVGEANNAQLFLLFCRGCYWISKGITGNIFHKHKLWN